MKRRSDYFNIQLYFKKGSYTPSSKQDKMDFNLMMKFGSFNKLNKKQKRRVITYIKNYFLDDLYMIEHYHKEYGIPMEMML